MAFLTSLTASSGEVLIVGGFELAILAVFSFLLFLRVVVLVVFAFAVIRRVRSCPVCFLPTVPVRVPWRLVLPPFFEWRWCPDCGWEGPARRDDGETRLSHGADHPLPRPIRRDLEIRTWEGDGKS
ncbi:MAG: hypothetical protein EXR92_03405 [Gemmatimonadetes bacterium]|nr:hypothetical protein [Gemmatimonadota bacterium]